MAKMTLIFATLLIITGLVGYFAAQSSSLTALIPLCFGLVIGLCGLIGLNEALERQALLGATLVGFLGFVGSAMRVPKSYTKMTEASSSSLAFVMQATMAGLCLLFIILCIRWILTNRG
jgi:uncharacterized membrane protein (UPF0136 family)